MTVAMVELYRILGRFEKGPHDDPNCRLTAEGAALDAYLCSADKPTLAFGCTYHPDGTPVRLGDSITEDQVYPYTEAAVARVVADVKRIVKRPLNDYQMAALCSFVFNLGGKNLADSTRLLPDIEAGRWEDAAESLGEFIRAWGKLEGKWHRKAERGLLIRRDAEGCLLLGLDWQPWCNTTNIKLVEKLHWQPDWVDPKGIRTGGRYYDEVLPETTQFTTIEAMARATPLPSLELILTTKADPAAVPASGAAGQPGPMPNPVPADLAPAKEPAKISPDTAVVSKIPPNVDMKPGATSSPAPGPTPPPKPPQGTSVAPVPVPKPPAPPAPMPPSVQVSTTNDMGPTTKSMYRSKRFWGGALIIVGRLIILLDVSGNFAPAVRGLIGDGVLMDWMTGIIVTMVGEMVLDRGEKKAEGPIDTPKRVALMTPAP